MYKVTFCNLNEESNLGTYETESEAQEKANRVFAEFCKKESGFSILIRKKEIAKSGPLWPIIKSLDC